MNDTHTLVGAYALDALSPDERVDFENHLAECAGCRDDLSSLADVTASLADAEAVAPPSGLRTRVMGSVAATAQEGVVDLPAVPTKARRRWPVIVGAAASLLVLAGVGVVAGGAWNSHQDQLALEQDVMMVTSAPDAHAMDLSLGQAHLVVSDKMGAVVAMGQDAPMPAEGMEYQVWLMMDDGAVMPGPTFAPSADGEFMAMMHSAMDGVVGVAVTEEPMGGSSSMTGSPVAVVHL